MKLNNFIPTFRQVLFSSEDVTKSEGGIFIPEIAQREKAFTAVKVGQDCSTIKPLDRIVIMDGILPHKVVLDGDVYYLITEQQIIGYERNDSTGTPLKRKSKVTRSSQLQEG